MHEFFHFLEVFGRVERQAVSFSSVTAGAPGFLVVAFERFGHVVVDYVAHVGLVDTHAEGYGCHNHVDLFQQECVLVGRAGGCVHSSMIWEGLDVVDFQQFCKFLHFLAAEAVDYS